ncbi:MAG TPA: RNase adapter RapZ [Bacteroidales bacterium]|nr:RNase adapter RapZ [Bacteroidales bacterium]
MDTRLALQQLYSETFGTEPSAIVPLRQSGSNRQYFRIQGNSESVIGTYGNDVSENKAFFYLTKHFTTKNIPVPRLIAVSADNYFYLQEDIGDTSLFSLIEQSHKEGKTYSPVIENYFKKVIEQLVLLQREASGGINFRLCYPYHSFGIDSVLYDLRYFVFYFAKIFDLNYNELFLEKEFKRFAALLVADSNTCFMYRDFQSRNIFIKNSEVVFIDYQAGRKGPPQYDLASLLYQAKAMIPENKRKELLEFYLDLSGIIDRHDRQEFTRKYYMVVCVRLLQTLGAYGLRGIIEQKNHFIQSIPPAISNLKNMLPVFDLKKSFPEMHNLLLQATEISGLDEATSEQSTSKLNVLVHSFSYKKGAPRDYSGNGGGFIFDCRGLLNPGKLNEYSPLTGNDKEVIRFLNNETEANQIVANACKIVAVNIDSYIERNFKNLMIGFGCTGGRHRSVYCCNRLAKTLNKKYRDKIVINVWHKELKIKYSL